MKRQLGYKPYSTPSYVKAREAEAVKERAREREKEAKEAKQAEKEAARMREVEDELLESIG